MLKYLALTLLVGFILGLLLNKRDIFAMFKKGSEVSEKKALLFISVLTVTGTFSYSYTHSVVPIDGALDVGWGWVVLISATILSFLAPDAFVKISKVIAKAFVGKIGSNSNTQTTPRQSVEKEKGSDEQF